MFLFLRVEVILLLINYVVELELIRKIRIHNIIRIDHQL
jgi:hypothetical protein